MHHGFYLMESLDFVIFLRSVLVICFSWSFLWLESNYKLCLLAGNLDISSVILSLTVYTWVFPVHVQFRGQLNISTEYKSINLDSQLWLCYIFDFTFTFEYLWVSWTFLSFSSIERLWVLYWNLSHFHGANFNLPSG